MTDAQVFKSFCALHAELTDLVGGADAVGARCVAQAMVGALIVMRWDDAKDTGAEAFARHFGTVASVCGIGCEEADAAIGAMSPEMLEGALDTVGMWNIGRQNHKEIFRVLYEKYITKKESGAYYTDDRTTDHIVRNTIAACDGQAIRLLDPTCGTGSFIVKALDVLAELAGGVAPEVVADLVRHHLYGVDIDAEAVTILRYRLYCYLLCAGADASDAGLYANFRIGDAISDERFDWQAEFADVFAGGGFNCIVGNPPYVETRRTGPSHPLPPYFTTSGCGNLYAYVIDRCLSTLLSDDGAIGLIVPVSIVSTPRMAPLRTLIERSLGSVTYENYADRPACLFNGVHQKLTILIGSRAGRADGCHTRMQGYRHWYTDEADTLFADRRSYELPVRLRLPSGYPKLVSEHTVPIIDKVMRHSRLPLTGNACADGPYSVWVNMRMCFWTKVFMRPQESREYRRFAFASAVQAGAFAAVVSSSLFYYLWEVFSDCWHITSKDIDVIHIDFGATDPDLLVQLAQAYAEFADSLDITRKYIGSVQTDYIYRHKYHKRQLDVIDGLLARIFGLTPAELAEITGYQLQYRLNRTQMNVIDLFAGVGGFSRGFEDAGYRVVLANELDPAIARSYRHNHPGTLMVCADIADFTDDPAAHVARSLEEMPHIDPECLYRDLDDVSVIIGGPPCQGFSMAGARIRRSHEFLRDPRNQLFRYYLDALRRYEPRYFVFENVQGILSSDGGAVVDTMRAILGDAEEFAHGPYHTYMRVFDAADYGVPQHRRRVIIFGSKTPIDFEAEFDAFLQILPPRLRDTYLNATTVRDAIADLADLPADGTAPVPNHIATRHSDEAMRRIRSVACGQNWRDLPDADRIRSVHSGAYGRLDWDAQATTVTTRFDAPSAGRYIHPSLDRCITPREAARLQTFPDDFEFLGSRSCICRQIGNAVPVRLARLLAHFILYLDSKNSK